MGFLPERREVVGAPVVPAQSAAGGHPERAVAGHKHVRDVISGQGARFIFQAAIILVRPGGGVVADEPLSRGSEPDDTERIFADDVDVEVVRFFGQRFGFG